MEEAPHRLRLDGRISSRHDLWLAVVISVALHGTFLMVLVMNFNLRPVYHPAVYGMGSGPSVLHFVSGTSDGARGEDAEPRSSPVEIAENPSPTPAPSLEPTTSEASVSEETEPAENSATEPLPSEPLAAVGPVNGQSRIVGVAGGTISRSPDGQGNSSARGGSDAVESVGGGTGYGIPAYLRNPPPAYPRVAREHGWEGTTLLQVEVLDDGSGGKVEVLRSSGYEVLDEAAVTTVRHWKFLPARSGDTPIRSLVEIPIRFRLAAN